MSEWWDPVEVKEKKGEHLALPLYGKGGCLFSLIGVLLIIGGCSQMEDTGGGLSGWDKWSPIVFIGLIILHKILFLELMVLQCRLQLNIMIWFVVKHII